MRQLPLGVRLRDRASFASFVPGGNTELVRSLESLARREPSAGSRVAFLHGTEGAGKTHLLLAATALASADSRAGYVDLKDLVAGGPTVLEGWQGLDFVAVDEVQAVIGDSAWEAALFRLYRDFEERGAALVFASERPPSLLPWTLPDLRTRLVGSPTHLVRELDEAGRLDALKTRAALRGVELPPETLRYLQRRFPRDMRTMYALLDALDDAALSAQRRLTVPFVREVLGREPGQES